LVDGNKAAVAKVPASGSVSDTTLCDEIGILVGEVNPINRIIRKPAAIRSYNRVALLYLIQPLLV
jgi:hypothetical protein